MSPTKKKTVEEEEPRQDCLLCAFKETIQARKGRHDKFFDHLKKAEGEVLKAVRSLIDDRLEDMEEKPKKKATKIKVG